MKYWIYILALSLTACALPQFMGGEGMPVEQSDQAVGLLGSLLAAFTGPVGPLVLTTLYGGTKAYNASKGQKKIVGALEGAFDAMDDQDVQMVKSYIRAKMDDKTQKLVKKVKKKL